MVLDDGERCTMRDGGAWDISKKHPQWNGAYGCDHHDNVVWATSGKPYDFGVDESKATWTVLVGPFDGNGPFVTHEVRVAYFVRTALS